MYNSELSCQSKVLPLCLLAIVCKVWQSAPPNQTQQHWFACFLIAVLEAFRLIELLLLLLPLLLFVLHLLSCCGC